MQQPRMQEFKLKRFIATNGEDYMFTRKKLDDRGQPVRDEQNKLVYEQVGKSSVKAVYHETGTFFTLLVGEAAEVKTKKSPQLFCLWSALADAEVQLQIGDRIVVNSKTYEIDAVRDVYDWQLVADISLEVVDDGRSVV